MSVTDKWCITDVKTKKCSYTWTIRNFSYLSFKTGEEFPSPLFTIESDKETKWYLRLYVKGINDNFKDYLSVYLYRKSADSGEYKDGQIVLSIINDNKEKLVEQKEIYQYHRHISSWGFPAFIKREDVYEKNSAYLNNNCLTLHCEITMMVGCLNITSAENSEIRQQISKSKATEDFEKIFLSERFSDVKLVTLCGKELHAHKNILTARSSIFSAMFEHEMVESQLNLVEITDVDYNVLKEMIRFVYTDKVENIENIACELLAAADKYEINGLKCLCEDFLFNNMSVKNIIDILIVSDRHNVHELKKRALDYIKINVKDIIKLSEFNLLESSLLREIIKILVDS